MKSKFHNTIIALALLALCTLNSELSTLKAQGTAFTYQGQLQNNGSPANGFYDFQFALYPNAAGSGSQVGGTVTNLAVDVTNGLFTTSLDFGPVLTGSPIWLAISVRTNGVGGYVGLTPLQPLSPAPYAIYSANAASALTAASANSVAAGNIVGTVSLAQLPGAVMTNNESGVNLAGAFSGNGGGLTNLQTTNLAGTLADSQLSTNIARLSVPNTNIQATGGPVVTSGFITSANVTNGGSGYTNAPLVTVTDVTGSNAVITASVVGGSVVGLAVQNPGSHYSAAATLTIAPPPSSAVQTFSTANIFNGANTFNSSSNSFVGSFTGNGGGLTNLIGNGGNLTNINAANLTGSNALPLSVLPANVAFLNSNQTFSGVNSFTTNIAIGVASTPERLEVDGTDTAFSPGCSIRIRNTSDPVGGFIGDGWEAIQFGMYNPSATSVGVIAAGAKRSLFGFDQSGKVGSLANSFGNPNYRNLLDDGDGNMSIAGNCYLPATTANAGIIYCGGSPVIHSYGSASIYVGAGAGNFTMT
ncbi:MAG: hypothetical protein ABSA47_08590, partial [Verrucomicrobiota bacterium]